MNRNITQQSLSILEILNERKSTGKNDVKCRLYQARHANNGYKIPAKTLMEALGGKFPKAYNSRVNKVYDWRNKKYRQGGESFVKTSHEEYLKGGIDAPSLSSEYKEILAYEHEVYACVDAYLKHSPFPDGINNPKQLAEMYILQLEHDRPSDIKEAIQKGREILKASNHSFDKLNGFDQLMDVFEMQSIAILLHGSQKQKSRVKDIAFRLINEIQSHN